MAAGQGPGAEVDAQLDDVGMLVAVCGDRHRPLDASMVGVDGHERLLDSAPWSDDAPDIPDDGVALGEPGIGLDHEALERAASLHAAADRMMELRLAGERPDERVRLAGHHSLEVRDSGQLAAGLIADALQRGAEDSSGIHGTGEACHSMPTRQRRGTPSPSASSRGDRRGAVPDPRPVADPHCAILRGRAPGPTAWRSALIRSGPCCPSTSACRRTCPGRGRRSSPESSRRPSRPAPRAQAQRRRRRSRRSRGARRRAARRVRLPDRLLSLLGRELGRDDFVYGQFGENFTVEGLSDDEVCVGDRYRIGTAVFEVTQPRVTCYRVGSA